MSCIVCGCVCLNISLVRCNERLLVLIKVYVYFIYSTAYIYTCIVRHCVMLCKSFLSVYILVNVCLLIVHYQLFLCCMSVIVHLSFLIVVHDSGCCLCISFCVCVCVCLWLWLWLCVCVWARQLSSYHIHYVWCTRVSVQQHGVRTGQRKENECVLIGGRELID